MDYIYKVINNLLKKKEVIVFKKPDAYKNINSNRIIRK